MYLLSSSVSRRICSHRGLVAMVAVVAVVAVHRTATVNSCLSLSLGIDQIRRQQQHLLLSVSLWTLMGKKMTKF